MTARAARLRSGLVAILLFDTACGHTPSFVDGDYRSTGPFRTVNGMQQFTILAWTGGHERESPRFTDDGRGIVYVVPPQGGGCARPGRLPEQITPFSCVGAVSASLLPSGGGSALWELQRTDFFPPDSAAVMSTPAVNPAGRVLYIDRVFPVRFGYSQPVQMHADLWLADTSAPFSLRRHLVTLYHDSIGHPAIPPGEVSWLEHIAWIGNDSFVAVGAYPQPYDSIMPVHVVLGVIGTGEFALQGIAGTEDARLAAPAEAGRTIVLVRDSVTIERAPISGGTRTVVAVVADAPERRINDLSCRAGRCLILTKERDGWTLWRLALSDGSLLALRSFSPSQVVAGADLAPGPSGDVVANVDGRIYLIPGLVVN